MITYLIYLWVFLIVTFSIYEYFKVHVQIRSVSKLLQAAAANLIREMENNPVFTPGKYGKSRKQDYNEVIIDNLERLQPRYPMIAIGNPQHAVTHLPAATEILENNQNFTKEFWFVAQGLRNGLQVYIALFVLDNPDAAYLKMIEHMKRQRNELVQKGTMRSLNFSELKIVLDLPTEWPKGELPEQLERKQVNWSRSWLIRRAIKSHRSDIFRSLTYKPYAFDASEAATEFVEEDVLLGMREYIR